MFGAILKATNSSFRKGMAFCRSVYVKKVMTLLAFIFEQPSYRLLLSSADNFSNLQINCPQIGPNHLSNMILIKTYTIMVCCKSILTTFILKTKQ